MKNLIKKIFSRGHVNNTDVKNNSASSTQIKQKKEKVIQRVGKNYGRALSRLSDT